MGYQTDLLTGLAQDLAGRGIGVWSPAGSYAAADTAIVLATVPQAPDRVITLTWYAVSDDPTLSDTVSGVQVRCRWAGQDPRPASDLSDLIFDAWHGASGLTLATGVRVVECSRRSAVSLGQDANGRWSTSQNFYLTTHRPSPHRT